MKKLTLKKLMTYELIFIFFIGALMHFIYSWFPNPVTALFSPINESVWEHLKMLILPITLVGIYEYRIIKRIDLILWTKLCQLVFIMLFMVSFFYTYTGAFGVRGILIIDIISFFMAIYFGQKICYRILTTRKKPPIKTHYIVAILVLIFAAFINFTYSTPSIPLFQNQKSVSSSPR